MKDFQTLPYDICRGYVRDYESVLGPEISKRVTGWTRSRNLQSLASCVDLFPDALHDRETRRCLMQIQAFFKKASIFSDPNVCKPAALNTFLVSERKCRIVNKRLDFYYLHADRLNSRLRRNIETMENWIASVLGPFEDFQGAIPEYVRFTSGATSSTSRRDSLPFRKVKEQGTTTPGLVPYCEALGKYYGQNDLSVIPSNVNRVEFVPKSWKTDRTIACEPEWALPLQLAFDSYVKRRLRKRGIDLSDQTRNQRLAYEGSVSNNYSTIDLSAASDTVSYNTVAWLLPRPWFLYLARARSSFGRVSLNGDYIKYAKFSSMGNGATFCLETLIFASACYAVGSRTFSVYGDDIIIEPKHVPDLLALLAFLGFSVNREKSHIDGPFKESCGVNYFDGIDITPFYIRDLKESKPLLCHLVNGLVPVSVPGGELEKLLLSLVEKYSLPLVPFNENSMSGVWIDCHTAYTKGLIVSSRRSTLHIPMYVSFVLHDKRVAQADCRTAFLWHLRANQRRQLTVGGHIETSSVPCLTYKYVRKWVYWVPPVVGTPCNLYDWTEQVTRLK